MKIQEASNYRQFLRESVRTLQNTDSRRGHLSRLANALSIHGSTLSQVLKGGKDLTLDQACKAGEYLGLSDAENDLLLLLVQLERADSEPVRRSLRRQLELLRGQFHQLANVLPHEARLSEQ